MKTNVLFLIALTLLISFCTPETQKSNWYPFTPGKSVEGSEFGMSDWLDAPAGKHGFLQINHDQLVFEDGTPIKFWGVNICSQRTYPDKQKAEQWTDFMAHYGINSVRFHKFTSHALKGEVSTVLDPEMFDRFDYFNQSLRKKGIYYGWSHIYGHKPRQTDSSRLVAYEEIANATYPWAHLNGSTAGVINFAEDLQELNIELTVNMLNHLNPHSGLRYADDPALLFIELQNEDNIYWGAIQKSLEQMPTYQRMLNQKFCDWLRKKYGNESALFEAWGSDAIPGAQSLSQNNIDPQPDHHLFSAAFEKAKDQGTSVARDIADKMRFLYEEQEAFYGRFIEAIRETGYKGTIVASCWQAGSGISHYYNLHNDYLAGIIDRHNYFGGGTGHRLDTGRVRNSAMVSRPGSGLLSSGMQQVADRPFAFSEWMSLMPNEWIAEGPPIIAAYGMGLQGWDASFQFASDYPHYTETIHTPGVYNTMSPTQLGLYPVLARMIYRKDIQEAEVISSRNVSLSSMLNGTLGFNEKVQQDHDVKYFTGDVPSEALASGRLVVSFADQDAETNAVALDKLSNSPGVIRSITEQLEWNYSEEGYFTINTDGTKAVVGFGGGKIHQLGDIKVSFDNPFAVLLMTAMDQDESLQTADRILVIAMARARNTGMQYNEEKTKLLNVGEAPILMEPVSFTLEFMNNYPVNIQVLDHMGKRMDHSYQFPNGTINIDGAETKTMYYIIERGT